MIEEQKDGKSLNVFNALEKTHIKEHYKYKDIEEKDDELKLVINKNIDGVMSGNSSRSKMQIAKNDLRLKSTQEHFERNLSEKSDVLGPFNTS